MLKFLSQIGNRFSETCPSKDNEVVVKEWFRNDVLQLLTFYFTRYHLRKETDTVKCVPNIFPGFTA